MGASQSSLTPNEGSRPLQDQQEQCGRCGCACAQTREPHAGPPSFPPAQFLHSASAAWPSDKGPTCPLQPPARPIPASLNSSYMGFPWPLPQPFPSHDATSTSIGSSMPASWPQDWVETPWPGARGRPSSPNPDRPLVVMNFAPSYLWARPQRVPPLGMSCAMAGTPGHGTSRGPSSSSADVTVVPPLTGSALPTRPLLPREQGHLHSSLCSQDQTNVPSDSSCSTATPTPRPWTDRSAELSLSIFSYTINGLVARIQSENVYSRTQKGVWHHASWRGHKPSPRLRAAFQNRW